MRVILQSAFILHTRPYRESSLLLDIFSCDYGRLSLIAKGVRNTAKGLRALLQPFTPLLLTFTGKTELMILQSADLAKPFRRLKGDALFNAFYINELLMRLLPKADAYTKLYGFYEDTLEALSVLSIPITLRLFEKKLLQELGYGLSLQHEMQTKIPLAANEYYQYLPNEGLIRATCNEYNKKNLFQGKNLLAIAIDDLQNEEVLKDAKRLMRIVFASLLGAKPLGSRTLFIKF